jgi:outer membrane protein assembly factor BamB
MAFSLRHLSVLAYANGFTLWHYKAGQAPLSVVSAPGFFAEAEDILATGDMMMVSAADGAGMLCIAPSAGQTLRLA